MGVYKHGIANDRHGNVTNVQVIRMEMKEQDSVGMDTYILIMQNLALDSEQPLDVTFKQQTL